MKCQCGGKYKEYFFGVVPGISKCLRCGAVCPGMVEKKKDPAAGAIAEQIRRGRDMFDRVVLK